MWVAASESKTMSLFDLAAMRARALVALLITLTDPSEAALLHREMTGYS